MCVRAHVCVYVCVCVCKCVCVCVSLKMKACKTNAMRKSVSLFHAKSKTKIGCWNVRTLGALSEWSEKPRSVLRTMKEKRIEILAMSESRWPGQGITRIRSHTILHSGTPSSHVHGIALALSPNARASWKAAGSVFHVISDRIISIHIKTHYTFATILAVYAPTNPINTTQEARAPSVAFYDQLQSSIASVPQNDMIIVLDIFNACVGGPPAGCPAVGPHGLDDCNENGELLRDFCVSNNLLSPTPGSNINCSTSVHGTGMAIVHIMAI